MGFWALRRSRIVESYLTRMIASGTQEAAYPELFFEAACRYAQDNGGVRYSDTPDCIMFDKIINGSNYSVFFTTGARRTGTSITLKQQRPAYDIAKEEADKLVDEVRLSMGSSTERALLTCVKDSFLEKRFVTLSGMEVGNIEFLFDTFRTDIPSEVDLRPDGLVRLGLLDIPGLGLVFTAAALIDGEAFINATGPIEEGHLASKKTELREFQRELFQDFCLAVHDEPQATESRSVLDELDEITKYILE